jgi:NAD-dependent deacetylase
MGTTAWRDAARQAAEQVATARRVVVLTGAGVSAESGVPTFRGPEGLWRSHRPEELATPEAFARDPALVWEWYRWRRRKIAACTPNAAHQALARLALGRPGVTLVTQNVDGLHARAALEEAQARAADPAPAMPLELHGAIHRDRCHRCGVRSAPVAGAAGPAGDPPAPEPAVPACGACGGALRPDVVWFGELLDERTLGAAFAAAEQADVCLVVGTSGVVYPAAALPSITRQAGGRVVEVNPEETGLSGLAHVRVVVAAAVGVPAIVGG